MKLFNRDNWFFYKSLRDRTLRLKAAYDPNGRWSKEWSGSLETAWRKKVSPGFSIRFGNSASETPIDAMISFYWLAFFWSFRTPSLGKFCEWLGRGHKREISLKFFDGTMWWRLWYNDDLGYDPYHRCDKWRTPKLYPWRWGRKKYRSWMCLRDGNINLNPLDAFWGSRLYHYQDIQKKTKKLRMNQFPGDVYDLNLTLQEAFRQREHGPKWVRRRKSQGFRVDWESVNNEGVPIRNHEWKGDGILASSERIDTPANWVVKCLVQLTKRIEADRSKYNYKPPLEWKTVGYMPADGITMIHDIVPQPDYKPLSVDAVLDALATNSKFRGVEPKIMIFDEADSAELNNTVAWENANPKMKKENENG